MNQRDSSALTEIVRLCDVAANLVARGDRGYRPSELRIRVGDYRVVRDVQDDERVVMVLRIGHRREAYR